MKEYTEKNINKNSENLPKDFLHLELDQNKFFDDSVQRTFRRHSLPIRETRKKSNASYQQIIEREKNFKEDILSYNMCKIHNKSLDAYCKTDKLLICILCIVEKKHDGHNIISTDEAFKYEREEILNFESNLYNTEKHFSEQLKIVDKYENLLILNKDENCAKVNKIYSSILKHLSEMQDKSNRNLHKKFITESEKLYEIRETIDNLLNVEKNELIKKFFDLTNSKTSNLFLLSNMNVLDNRYKEFIKNSEDIFLRINKLDKFFEKPTSIFIYNYIDELEEIKIFFNNQIEDLALLKMNSMMVHENKESENIIGTIINSKNDDKKVNCLIMGENFNRFKNNFISPFIQHEGFDNIKNPGRNFLLIILETYQNVFSTNEKKEYRNIENDKKNYLLDSYKCIDENRKEKIFEENNNNFKGKELILICNVNENI